jgi:hypothetical protein
MVGAYLVDMKPIPLVLLGVLVAGCSHGSAASSTTQNATTSSPRPNGWTSLVSLRELGQFSTRCVPSKRFSTLYRADPQTADEEVSVSVNGGAALKRTLQPGQTWISGGTAVHYQIWKIAQATEPGTITATVRIAPSRCPYGVPATSVKFGTSHFNSRS